MPSLMKMKNMNITASIMVACLSFCILFHYQCTYLASSLQSGRRTIFNMGGTPHENAGGIRPNTTLVPWAFFNVGENIGLNTPKKTPAFEFAGVCGFQF
jgi:hypothetical protein